MYVALIPLLCKQFQDQSFKGQEAYLDFLKSLLL